MKITRKRTPLVLAGAAVAAALVALPATAAADESKAVLSPHGFNGPEVDGKFDDWKNPPRPTEPNSVQDLGSIHTYYNCRTGILTVAVRGHRPMPAPAPVQSQGVNGNGGPYVTVERLPSKPPNPDYKFTPDNAYDFAYGEGGYEMSFPLKAPGAYKLHYYGGRKAPAVTGAGEPTETRPYEIGGYAYIKVQCPVLHIEKTAKGYYDHIFDWSIQKKATIASKDSKTPVVKYDIDVKKTGPRTINRDVRGTIKVTNHSPIFVPRVRVADHGIGAKDLCRITGVKVGKDAVEYKRGENYVLLRGLMPKQSAYVDYICHPHPDIPPHQLPKKPVNKASVSWADFRNGDNGDNGDTNGEVSASGGAGNGPIYRPKNIAYTAQGFQFDTLDDVYKEAVHVLDKSHAGKKHLGVVKDSTTISYTTKLKAPRPGKCRVFGNTAYLNDPGNKSWDPKSSTKVKICVDEKGGVKAIAKNPKKPSVDYDKRRRCYVNLRTRMKTPRLITQRPTRMLVQIGNRGKIAAGHVRTHITLPKGVKVLGVRGVSRKQVKVRGRQVYVFHKWVPLRRARNVVLIVKAKRSVKRPRRGVIRAVSRHNCDTSRARARVIVAPRPLPPPPPPAPDNDNV